MAQSAAGKVVALPPIVDLDALDHVRDGLIDAVETGAVVIDASKVERVSTNALFMLLSASESSRRGGFPCAVSGASAPMTAAIERLGLGATFAEFMKG